MADKTAILSIRILGDASKAVSEFDTAGGAAEGLGARLGGLPWAAIGTAAAGAAVAAGKALYDIGETFDGVADTIRIGTGATGDALDGLVDVAKNVGTQVPAQFDDIAPVVADLNTRLGLSGDTLQTVASQYLEAGRILGQDVDINATSAAFSAFHIEGDAVVGAMDTLFQVSQATGVGMNDLAGGVQTNALAMQELGFTFEDSVSLFGSLDKAGVDASSTLKAMQKGMLNLAQPGEDTAAAFRRVTGELQGYIDAGDTGAALDIAGKVFGTKGAAQMVQALQDGTLNMNNLFEATGATSDTILGVGEETMDAAEKWEILKNKALVALEPIGSALFDGVGKALDWVMGLLEGFNLDSLSGAGEVISTISDGFAAFADGVQTYLAPFIETVAPLVADAFKLIGTYLGDLFTLFGEVFGFIGSLLSGDWEAAWEHVTGIVDAAVKLIGDLLSGMWTLIVDLLSGLWDRITGIFQSGVDLVTGIWGTAWDWITTAVSNAIGGVIGFVSDLPGNIVSALGDLGHLLLDAGAAIIQGLIDGITGAIGGAISAVIDGIGGLVDSVLGFLGIHSPSRVFRDIGANTGRGLVLGIDDMAPKVADAWTDLMDVPGGPTLTARLDPASARAAQTAHAAALERPAPTVNITIQGALDPVAVAQQIRGILGRADTLLAGATTV